MSIALCPDVRAPLPLVLNWGGSAQPLPVRRIQPTRRPYRAFPDSPPPPWLPTGPIHQPFDFCGHVRRLCADIVVRCPELYHIDVQGPGGWRCDCGDATFRTRPNGCKHAAGLFAALESIGLLPGREAGETSIHAAEGSDRKSVV